MAFNHIELEVSGAVGWFRFNRAPRNAVDWEMLFELAPAFAALAGRPDVKVIVLASAIEAYFSTGADLAAFKGVSGDRMKDWIGETHRLAKLIRSAGKPVLAAINGVAVGGGLEMTLHADLRFAASNARFGQPEVNIAFIPPVAGTQGLVRLVGRSRAFQILYGGEIMDAADALKFGLVDFVVPPDRLESEVQAYGEMLAGKPANALAAIRRCLVDGGAVSFDEGLEVEKHQAEALADHPNFQEGISAFLAKRNPEWS